MNINRHDDELEQLLQAQEPIERADLAAFLTHLQGTLPETPRAEVAERHLAVITTAATEAAHDAPSAAATAARSPWRARARRLAGLTAVKVAIGVTAAAAATGTGLATTGNLPDPAQQVVSDLAERIGIELPAPDTTPPATLPDEVPSTIPPRETPAADDAHDGHQPTPARPEGGAPPTEVPGEGQPPAEPSERADDRGAAGPDETPSRRPEGAGSTERGRAAVPDRDRGPAGTDVDVPARADR